MANFSPIFQAKINEENGKLKVSEGNNYRR